MNRKKPLVSVCVQTYNQEAYIEKCLDSILMQKTNFLFEIILGEDQSDDKTKNICVAYSEKYPEKIKLFLRDRKDVILIDGNITGRYNFIENLKSCQGKYIALCEGDDYWTDNSKLQKQVDYLEANQNVNLCFHRADVLKNGQFKLHPIPGSLPVDDLDYIDLLKHYNFITTASVVFRKPNPFVLPNWFHKVIFGDLGLYKLVSNEKKIGCINEKMSVYRVHDKGLYSGISEFKAKQNYYSFYRSIFPVLNSEEQYVARKKMKGVLKTMSKLKFPKSRLLQKFYYIYHNLK